MARNLGRLLREKRESRYLSLPEAELATHVRAEHLRALEEGRFKDLPGEAYVEIYLREYARFLDLDPDPLLQAFDQRMRWPRFRQRLGRKLHDLVRAICLPLLAAVLLVALTAGATWFVTTSYWPAPPTPSPLPTAQVEKHLTLLYPQDRAQVIGPQVILVGHAPPGASVLVDGVLLQVQADGHFTHAVPLEVGETYLRVQARDSTGWGEEVQRVILRPAPTPLPTLVPAVRDRPQEHQVVVNQIDTTHYPDLVAYFSVLDAAGEPWPALTLENLALQEGGKPIAEFVLSTVPVSEPVAVALVVDVNGSMVGEPLTQTQEALRSFVEKVGPDAAVALISFNEKVSLRQGFTLDKGALATAVGDLRAGGDTALYDAILFGIEQVAGQPFGRRAVIVLTGGRDTASANTMQEAIAQAGLLNIPVYALGLESPDYDGGPLERLARETGATYLLAPEASALGDLYARLNRQLQGQYKAVYRSPGSGGEEHRLTLTTRINGVVRQSSKSYRAP